jgi:hypothetical protein
MFEHMLFSMFLRTDEAVKAFDTDCHLVKRAKDCPIPLPTSKTLQGGGVLNLFRVFQRNLRRLSTDFFELCTKWTQKVLRPVPFLQPKFASGAGSIVEDNQSFFRAGVVFVLLSVAGTDGIVEPMSNPQ